MIMINIFDGKEGHFIRRTNMNAKEVVKALNNCNAVELYYKDSDKPVSNYIFQHFKTDTDGFASLKTA